MLFLLKLKVAFWVISNGWPSGRLPITPLGVHKPARFWNCYAVTLSDGRVITGRKLWRDSANMVWLSPDNRTQAVGFNRSDVTGYALI